MAPRGSRLVVSIEGGWTVSGIESNVAAREAAEEALQLVLELGREEGLDGEGQRRYFEQLYLSLGTILHGPETAVQQLEEQRPLAEEWSTSAAPDEEDLMPFGKYEGEPIDTIPETYWAWLLEQEWFEGKYPRLFEYACEVAGGC